MKPKILVILGPTATGKSDIAVKIARKFNGEIVSADSRQVYKGMDLGSGKIMRQEMRDIPHYLLDIANPSKQFSVAQYKKLAEKSIGKILAKGKLPIIVGGTGFYIDSVVRNIAVPKVKPDAALRKKLAKRSTADLFAMLKKLSPSRAKNIDRHNPVRLIRAIEIARSLGHVPALKESPRKYDSVFIGLDLPDAELKKRIEKRLVKRLKLGMAYEVKKLHANGISWRRLESFGLEYREIAKYLQKRISKEEMIENLKNDIWHFVKRQRTWFKRNKEITWFRPNEIEKISEKIKKPPV
ncbi:MAG: tRNA (adenosine(37)-N6)-dimethylallyltransferase MiaA [Patescibacteria group bacterium]|nr:tRNA (adenosine(37)-N6)-dimethylallyltransferase MiaA [Patescibacteria group bacterium]MDE1946037.1 tRNA (adenosine(37)-N6)-dimethylallyltransferase MiaA [Patescibacteria group bacterium]